MPKFKQREIMDSFNIKPENPNKFYVELPDGYRLIYEDDKYVGRYNPNLNSVI